MNVAPKTVLICTNRRFRADQPSCAARGSEDIVKALRQGVAERGIDVEIEASVCMGHCPEGPTIRFAPGGRFIVSIRRIPQGRFVLLMTVGINRYWRADPR